MIILAHVQRVCAELDTDIDILNQPDYNFLPNKLLRMHV